MSNVKYDRKKVLISTLIGIIIGLTEAIMINIVLFKISTSPLFTLVIKLIFHD